MQLEVKNVPGEVDITVTVDRTQSEYKFFTNTVINKEAMSSNACSLRWAKK